MQTLYKKSSAGKLQMWKVEVVGVLVDLEDNEAELDISIVVTHGQVGGKLQTTSDVITEGKNIGKANETTIVQQAEFEAQAKWQKQIDRKGYVINKEDVDKDLRPGAEAMLAHRYDKYPDKITYPAFIQPKLDGHRCLAVLKDGKCELFSRQRKQINSLPHIVESLEALSKVIGQPNIVFDGELYNHDYKDNFEELTGFIRSKAPKDGYEAVQYHMYDIVSDTDFFHRSMALSKLTNLDKNLVIVETRPVTNDEHTLLVFKEYTNQGYEGAILRNKMGAYEGKRSYNLQKVKTFIDAEFLITGIEEGRGKMKGHAIFVCVTEDNKEFRAKMKGSMDVLAEVFQNQSDYLGKTLTVMFQEYTKDGIPRFPVGLRVREDV